MYKHSNKMYNRSPPKRFRNVPLAPTRSKKSNSTEKKEDVEWKISRRIESREKKKTKPMMKVPRTMATKNHNANLCKLIKFAPIV